MSQRRKSTRTMTYERWGVRLARQLQFSVYNSKSRLEEVPEPIRKKDTFAIGGTGGRHTGMCQRTPLSTITTDE